MLLHPSESGCGSVDWGGWWLESFESESYPYLAIRGRSAASRSFVEHSRVPSLAFDCNYDKLVKYNHDRKQYLPFSLPSSRFQEP